MNHKLRKEDAFKQKVAEILKDHIHFSGQTDGYVIHGALHKIWELHLQYLADHELISSPGDTIKELMSDRDIDKVELASMLYLPIAAIDDILEARVPLSETMAILFEGIFQVDRGFWINRERLYREKLKALYEGE